MERTYSNETWPVANFTGRGPKNFSRSDEAIFDEACEALWRSPEVDASEVEVRVENGFVNLYGTVTDRAQKKRVEELVEKVFGVKDVFNYLSINRYPGLIGDINLSANII